MALELPDVTMTLRYGYDALRPEIGAGTLERLRPGAYLPPASAGDPRWARRRTAVLARCVAVATKFTTSFAFSHATAALLHGWSVSSEDERVHIWQTVNPGAGQPDDVVRHVCAGTDDLDVTMVAGLPVTGADQTVLDCVRYLAPDQGLVVADSALGVMAKMSKFEREASLQRQQLVRVRLLDQLSALGPVRGVRRARAVLDVADGFATFPGESRMRWVALAGGLPVPECQHELWVGDKRYFGDVAWTSEVLERPWLVIAEFDGDIKYRGGDGAAAVLDEKRREDALRRRHRAEVVRFDTAQLDRPTTALRDLIDAFPPGCLPELHPRPLLQLRPTVRRPRSAPRS